MANQRLIDFPDKTTPTSTDILYLGDSTDSGRESQSTINQVAAADTVNLKVANNLSDVADVSTARTNLGLAIGVDVEAHSDALDSIGDLVTTENQILVTTASNTYTAKQFIAQKYSYAGGSASVTIPYTGITPDWVVWGNLESSSIGGAVSVKQVVPGTDQIGFVFTTDPGISIISWFGIESQQG